MEEPISKVADIDISNPPEYIFPDRSDVQIVASSPTIDSNEVYMPQSVINKRFESFLTELERKNSWGKNDLKTMFLEQMLGVFTNE